MKDAAGKEEELPRLPANVPAYKLKARKELHGWLHMLEAHPDREWFVKGDDDTYFLVENMLSYLASKKRRTTSNASGGGDGEGELLPYYLGRKFHLGGPGGVQYVSGGAGYALSRPAVV